MGPVTSWGMVLCAGFIRGSRYILFCADLCQDALQLQQLFLADLT